MDWYGMSCARPCALLRGPAFWCLYIMLSKSYLPRRCDWKAVFFLTPSMFNGEYGGFHHPAIYIAVTVSRRLSTQIQQEPTISLSKMTIPVSPKTLGTWRELGGSPSMLGAFSRDFLSYFDPMNGSWPAPKNSHVKAEKPQDLQHHEDPILVTQPVDAKATGVVLKKLKVRILIVNEFVSYSLSSNMPNPTWVNF